MLGILILSTFVAGSATCCVYPARYLCVLGFGLCLNVTSSDESEQKKQNCGKSLQVVSTVFLPNATCHSFDRVGVGNQVVAYVSKFLSVRDDMLTAQESSSCLKA